MERDNCKGCSASVRVPDSNIREMLEQIVNSGNFQISSEKEYEHRLTQCGLCKYLQYGHTCLQCGCIVHIRARIATSTCPFPSYSRW